MNYSPGNYHLRVPRKRTQNVRFRLFVLRKCRSDTRYRAAVREMCKRDILFWINTFVWQFNPNQLGDSSTLVGPFITWGVQEQTIRTILTAIEDRSDVIVEKSREMGASWMCLLIMLWFFIFHPMSKFLCVSRNADAVDDRDDSDSLFWKLDYVLERLPEWMIEKGEFTRKVMSFRNKSNGSMITGQATTGRAGVGGRCLAMFVDEFSQIDEAWEVYDRTSDTTGCRIFNGTHKGTKTCFFHLTTKADNATALKKVVLHWTQHPDKAKGLYRFDPKTQRVEYLDKDHKHSPRFSPVLDGSPTGGPCPGVRSPWYDVQCGRKGTSRAIAADLDIDPSGSVEQVFDALMIKDLTAKYCRPPYATCDLEYDKLTAEPVKLHEAKGGLCHLWLRLDADGKPPKGRYVFGADVAIGNGTATPSCLSAANAETGEKVLEYSNPSIEPKEFAYFMVAMARLFCDDEGHGGKLAWEIPGPGNTVTKHVIALGYRNVFYRQTEHRLKKEVSDVPGWSNSQDSFKSLIENYKDALRGHTFLNRSEFALSECLAFIFTADGYVTHTGWKDPRDGASAKINHGDRAVADALCWKLVDEGGKLVTVNVNTQKEEAPPTFQTGGLAWRAEIAKIRSQATGTWA